jgi:phage host-nuclease inhibitor protein Gam
MNAQQYNKLNEYLAEFSRISAAFESAEAEIKTLQLAAAQQLLPKHAELKVALTDLESQLHKFADAHYDELFSAADDKRTHATPFGSVKYRKSASIEFTDPEMVLLKIELACTKEQDRVRNLSEPPRFTKDQLVRAYEEPNLQALAELDDATLALFGCIRKHEDNFKVVPFAMKSDKPARAKKESVKEAA